MALPIKTNVSVLARGHVGNTLTANVLTTLLLSVLSVEAI